MNPFSITSFAAIWNYRRELYFVIFSFLILISLPIFAVILLTNVGIAIISDHLATINRTTRAVQLLNPLDGSVAKEIHPLVMWPVNGVVTLEFGQSDLPYQPCHTGIDIANPYGKIGDQITPFMEGKVIFEGELSWGFGKHIIIDNGNNITSIYAHLSKIYVVKGETVHLGQVIGSEGMTGWATGPHLHFQIDVDGIPVNPRTFLGQGVP